MIIIQISKDICLNINFSVFDQITAEDLPAIIFNGDLDINYASALFVSKGLCIYQCSSRSGSASYDIGSKINVTSFSVSHCRSSDDIINFHQGSVFILKTNISFGKSSDSSGFQIIKTSDDKTIEVKDVICTKGESGHVIEYGHNKYNIQTIAIFQNLIICNNTCSNAALVYILEIPYKIFFKNCFLEAPKNNMPFVTVSTDPQLFDFEDTYFCGNDFGSEVSNKQGFIKTDKLVTPSMAIGYETYLCEGALKNEGRCSAKTGQGRSVFIRIVLIEGLIVVCGVDKRAGEDGEKRQKR